MMQRIRSRLLLVTVLAATLAAIAPVLHAQQTEPFTVTLNPAQTSIRWTLNSTLHTVHGTFRLKSGEVSIDPATGEASGAIVVDASSGESGDSARDRRMHGVILESGSFPEITYRPTHVSGQIDLASGGDITVEGIFRLHGTNHPLQLTVHLSREGSAAKLTTRFTIPYVAWGMKDPSTFVFRTDKQVMLHVEAEFAAAPEHGPGKAILHPGEVHTAQ
jgi:polyisoprenoid-binding protein YceI